MRVCLATLETSDYLLDAMPEEHLPYGLVSFFYLKKDKVKRQQQLEYILSKISKTLLIDSGAHSFQHGKKVSLDDFVNQYIEFIKQNTNNSKIEGFFEMDVDNVIGYDKVLEYRRKLEQVSDKIIPVWHRNRGIKEFLKMCEEYKGRRIAITGFQNNDISDSQYNLFINLAHKYECKVHILGLTRFELIKDLNLGKDDSVDSSSWKQTGIFGGINLPTKNLGIIRISALEGLRCNYKAFIKANYITARATQLMYLDLDRRIYK